MFSSYNERQVHYVRIRDEKFVVVPAGTQEEREYDTIHARLLSIVMKEVNLQNGSTMPVWRFNLCGIDNPEEGAQLQLPVDSRYAEELIFKLATYYDMYQERIVPDDRVQFRMKLSLYKKRQDSTANAKLLLTVDDYKVFGRYRTPSTDPQQTMPSDMVVAVDSITQKEITMPVVVVPAHNWVSGALNRRIKVLSEERLKLIQDKVEHINILAKHINSPQW